MPKSSQSSQLGNYNYKSDYKDIFSIKKTNNSEIFNAINVKTEKNCCLKVISKEQLKKGDYDFLLDRIKKEEEITKLCKSENTIEFYRKLETKNYIIFELEECDGSLEEYSKQNGELKDEKEFFKEIVIAMAKAIKTLHGKGIIHRDIKPANIYYKTDEKTEKKIVKLGDFGCAIYKKDNISDPIGSYLYSAPEMAKDLEYDEKIDLWSLGKDRMTSEEFYNYAMSSDFMKEYVISINNNQKYKEIYNIIINEKYVEYIPEIEKEADDPVEQAKLNAKKINLLVKGGHFPDIMNCSNASAEDDNKINNIIYYDVNINHLSEINQDSDYFERATPGAFILCTNLDSLKLVRTEILSNIKNDKRIVFNFITTGSQCDNIMTFLKEDKKFDDCIKNICVFCANYDKWKSLKDKYEKVYDVYITQDKVIDFIKNFSSEDIKPYRLTKLITYNEYKEKYKDRHLAISKYYGDFTPESFKKNMEKIKNIIEKDNKENKLYKKKDDVTSGFLTFDIKKDLKVLDELIIKEYTKETFYGDLNKWLMDANFDSYETIAYFTARLMYSLNSYGKNGSYYGLNKTELRRGTKLYYSCLLPYERAKGKVILLSAFTSTTEDESVARNFSGRNAPKTLYKTRLKFSVIFIITNYCKQNWISNGVNIQKLSVYDESEILYQPFSFYYVRDVQIDQKNYKADIYLDTIGKYEILEEKIKNGEIIEYNQKERIMQVKK